MRYKLNQVKTGILFSLVCYIIFSSFSPQVADAKASRVRLQPVIVNGSDNTFFDTETVKYIKDPYRDVFILEVWIRTDDINLNGGYNLTQYYIRFEPRQYQQMQSIDYDKNSRIIEQSKEVYSDSRWKGVIPASIADAWYHQVFKYAKDNKIMSKRSVLN